MDSKTTKKLALAGAVLLVSYIAKQRLLAQWEESDRTGTNDLTYSSASTLIALSIPWDATVGLILRNRNVLIGDRGT